MDTGESEKEEDWVGLPASLAGIKLVDAPVLFFFVYHKAFSSELSSIRRAVASAASGNGDCSSEFVSDLARKLEFLKLVYNYHCAAEDEVIFLALDERVKNVIPSYLLEHASIDEKLASVFQIMYILLQKNEVTPRMFQELLFSLVTVQDMICKHMQKEEQQVFPLLKQKFTSEEQAELVWQYMCSVPVVLLEEFLPWMTFHLSPDEKVEVLDCIKVILPKEQVLQEVVVSWLWCRDGSISNPGNINGKGYRFLNVFFHAKDMTELYPHQILRLDIAGSERIDVEIFRNVIHEWHIAVRRDFNEIIEELQQIKSSETYSILPSLIAQLKFAADILIFYSNSLEKFLYPFLNVLSQSSLFFRKRLVEENQVASLQRLLFYEHLSLEQRSRYVEMLSEELESLVDDFSEKIVYLESKVFVFLIEKCSHEMQLWLLYTGLHMMPLGLLIGTITWFSAHLSESQSNSILRNLMLGCPLIDKSFTSLLYEWVRIGASGKTSVEKFRQNLQQMFNGRCYYLTEKVLHQSAVVSDDLPEPNSDFKANETVAIPSSSSSVTTEVHTAFYPIEMNLHLLFPTMFKTLSPVEKRHAEPGCSILPSLETRPMDHIFLIHRALIKDLDYLVSLSAKLAENVGFLSEFKCRFNLLHNMYQIHSISEDEIAFPALESKEALENICSSYSIDHKLEVLQFRKMFSILDGISYFHDVSSNETGSIRSQLCFKLHECCISMHRTLSDHIYREEVEIFSRFRGCFSSEEEEKVVGHMLGRLGAENLLVMVRWLMAYLTVDEQKTITSLWLKVTRNTRFDEWLSEWWEGTAGFSFPVVKEGSKPSPSLTSDSLEVFSMCLLNEGTQIQKKENVGWTEKEESVTALKLSGSCNSEDAAIASKDGCQSEDFIQYQNEIDRKKSDEATDEYQDEKTETTVEESPKLSLRDHLIRMNQDDLERLIRKVYHNSALDCQKKAQFVQNLRMSRWMATQKACTEDAVPNDEGEILGLCPSYRDPLKLNLGCKHYKRNCKLYAPCCEKLYTCIRCHDELVEDHLLDRKTITRMACMKCLKIQPIGPECTTSSCNGLSMARYYCSICKLFEDDRQIYHCPFCNICRVGKGLGVDYFHCMTCNACMSRSLFVHACREKCLEDNCSICHEYIFTSHNSIKGLPCGHFMHSACFRDYTCSHLICPICSKSLGDMQVYFGMIDALLAEEKTPEEHACQTDQAILCNDCEKRGSAPLHYLYHKCSHCGSYNTRLL